MATVGVKGLKMDGMPTVIQHLEYADNDGYIMPEIVQNYKVYIHTG